MAERRLTLANIQLVGREWEEIRFELQRFLESLNDTQDEDALAPGVDPNPGEASLSFADVDLTFSPYVVGADDDILLVDAASGAVTINLPTASLNKGRRIRVKKIDTSTNLVTLAGSASGALIDKDPTFDLLAEDEVVELACDGTDWWII
jgi:hypothetical protein